MNKIIRRMISVALLTLCLSNVVYAEHDNGMGNSQDGALKSISVAPEPSTFWLFLSGTLAMAAFGWHKRKSSLAHE
jgi:hypothetical protein